MKETITLIIKFIKKETVLVISIILALNSMLFVHPDKQYISYIDWHTLLLLFCLMAVMTGFKQLGLFQKIGAALLSHVGNTRQLFFVLVFLPFFFSMLITNDVALITFVPFAIIVLQMANETALLVPIVVMQTIAANLGSMLTPMGNPQNLYLYAQSGMSLSDFLLLTLPFTCIAFVCLSAYGFLFKKRSVCVLDLSDEKELNAKPIILFSALFLLCLFSVADLLDVRIVSVIVLLVLLVYDRKLLSAIDYSLLGTFIGFFVFIGNMERLPDFQVFLSNIVSGREICVSVLSSQIISNVPTALLLSGFSSNWNALIIGTNIGGLGTLIASMASLISYKQIAREYPGERGRYLLTFTIANVVLLLLLLGICAAFFHF